METGWHQDEEVTHSRHVRSWDSEPEPWLSGNDSGAKVWGQLGDLPTGQTTLLVPALDHNGIFHPAGKVIENYSIVIVSVGTVFPTHVLYPCSINLTDQTRFFI